MPKLGKTFQKVYKSLNQHFPWKAFAFNCCAVFKRESKTEKNL